MRVLITNNGLANRAGTELYVRDLALGLIKRGHVPVVYSERIGNVADELRAAGIRVIDNLAESEPAPDVIHGQHHLPTMIALMRFPRVPAVFVCHGPDVWQEDPPLIPRILRYVAVDEACKARLLARGVSPGILSVILNSVDLDRFKQRPALPARPQRALIFSNQAHEATHLPAIRRACRQSGITVETAGLAANKISFTPENLLPTYDLVFAKARSAIEAMAVGTAVVLCDAAGVGPMVTTSNFEHLRAFNFGIRCLNQPLDPALIAGEMARYDPSDAGAVCRRVRASGGTVSALDQFCELYESVIDEHARSPSRDPAAEHPAVAEYLSRLGRTISGFESAATELNALRRSRSWAVFARYAAAKNRLLRLSKAE